MQKNSRSDWGHVAATTSGAVATKCLAIGLKRRSSIESIETDLGDLYADAKENRFLMEFLDAGLSDMREISRVVTDIKISTLEHSVWHISDLKRSMALEKAAAFCRTGTEPPKKNLKLFSATTAAIVPLKFLALGKQIEKKVAAVAAVTGMPHPPTEILGPDLASIEWHLEENARLVDIFLATDERAKEKLALVLEKIGSNLYRLHEHVKHARVPLWRLWWYLP